MDELPRFRPQPDHRLQFFQGFLTRPKEVGSIIPSSRFLERRVVRVADIRGARTIVELGPGTGGTTRAVLKAMAPQAHLLAIEINARFARLLGRIPDRRLRVHEGSAAEIAEALSVHGLPPADAILSGIPFSTMPRELGLDILRSVHDSLAPGGVFVAYQVRDRVEDLGRCVFGDAQVQTVMLNVPPMRIYRWRKSAA
jgi:phosphatidylethanolamine/phosphatidyl-N-methylethanolamine N-methyltransferase